ncbi:MAG: carboxypeptidase-like regulatory domain-containing protein [Bacteroidota bacterium]|nr:carboxypeptidase-like regulatory domain-containing protein [Bacteroidota bacterium]
MKIKYIFIIIFLFLGLTKTSFGQKRAVHDTDLVQFTGFVISYDSTKTIPFVTIRIKGTNRGTYSDMQGYFSFVARKSDILVFTCIGYEPKVFIFPGGIKGTKFNSVVTLVEDTFFLEEYVLHNRPTKEQMDYIFSRATIPMDEYNTAQQNLRRKPLSDMSIALSNDGYENSQWTFKQYADKAYYGGQTQPIPVLDVFAWSKFIQSLEKGNKKRK